MYTSVMQLSQAHSFNQMYRNERSMSVQKRNYFVSNYITGLLGPARVLSYGYREAISPVDKAAGA
jgi:hypothetical protein